MDKLLKEDSWGYLPRVPVSPEFAKFCFVGRDVPDWMVVTPRPRPAPVSREDDKYYLRLSSLGAAVCRGPVTVAFCHWTEHTTRDQAIEAVLWIAGQYSGLKLERGQ